MEVTVKQWNRIARALGLVRRELDRLKEIGGGAVVQAMDHRLTHVEFLMAVQCQKEQA